MVEAVLNEAQMLNGDIHEQVAYVLTELGACVSLGERTKKLRHLCAELYKAAGWPAPPEPSRTVDLLIAHAIRGARRDEIAVRLRLLMQRVQRDLAAR